MSGGIKVSEVRFQPASDREQETGLLGWASLVVDGVLRLDSLAVRRTMNDRLVLAFPRRRGGSGQDFPYYAPVDNRARLDIEEQVLSAVVPLMRREP